MGAGRGGLAGVGGLLALLLGGAPEPARSVSGLICLLRKLFTSSHLDSQSASSPSYNWEGARYVPWATLHSEVGKERENAVLPSQTWSGYIFGGACVWSVIMPASSDFFFEASGFDDRSGCQDRSMVCRLTDELCLNNALLDTRRCMVCSLQTNLLAIPPPSLRI
jgi:hypothetical protein